MARSRFNITTSVRFDRTRQVAALIGLNSQNTVDQAARDLQTLAYQLSPVDTGALRNSIYVNNGSTSDYQTRVGTAERLNPDMEALEEIPPEFAISLSGGAASGDYITVVGVAAHYGIFLEEGTVNQPPQSFMRPASEAISDEFQASMARIADNV